MAFLFERKVRESRESLQPLSVVGLNIHQVQQFPKFGLDDIGADDIEDNFVDFLNQALMVGRKDLHAVSTWKSDRGGNSGYFVILLNKPHTEVKDLLNNLQDQLQYHPCEKNGQKIALPFYAGITQY